MRPSLLEKTDDEPILNLIVSCIESIECSTYFSVHLGKSQSEQKSIVQGFQNLVHSSLSDAMPDVIWGCEQCPCPGNRDAIDILGKGRDFVVVVELDKNRADQVAKKFVSRFAILPSTRTYFISLCYPGTAHMNKSECAKYFGYCATLARRMGSRYAGFIIQ